MSEKTWFSAADWVLLTCELSRSDLNIWCSWKRQLPAEHWPECWTLSVDLKAPTNKPYNELSSKHVMCLKCGSCSHEACLCCLYIGSSLCCTSHTHRWTFTGFHVLAWFSHRNDFTFIRLSDHSCRSAHLPTKQSQRRSASFLCEIPSWNLVSTTYSTYHPNTEKVGTFCTM